MDSSGFSSPRRADCFPAGLRVLVVDDDPTWLKILEKMLKKCNYEVTTCNLAREALKVLRERKDGFDIVISDVNMPDMDGFKLLEHVGLEMDLPVIMMSVDGETSRVMKGVQHGACDYLLKPIRMKELRNIWQHVFRKRIHEVRDIEGQDSFEEIQMIRGGIEQSDDGYLYGGDLGLIRKRKDAENGHDDRGCGDSSSLKKARVVWTVDLHQKFVKAVNQIGFEKVGPKKILDLMGVPWLTRENVASHLQKYRLYLSRLQKENELKAVFGGAKHLDTSLKDSSCTASLQSSVTQNLTAVQQTSMASESFTGSGDKVMIPNKEPKHCDGNVTGVLSNSRIESKKPIFGDAAVPAISNSSRISFSHHFGPMGADVKPEPKIPVQHSWVAEVPSHQLKRENKADPHAEHGFGHLPLPLPLHQTQVDSVAASLACNPGTSKYESDKPPEVTLDPSYGKSTCQGVENVGKDESASALFSVQSESHLTNCNVVDSMPSFLWNTKNHNLEHNLFDDLRCTDKNLDVGTESTLRRNMWDEGFNYYSCQGEFNEVNASIGNMEMFGYNNQEVLGDVPPHLYDPLKFEFEYPIDPVEYPVIDQGLFIAGPV